MKRLIAILTLGLIAVAGWWWLRPDPGRTYPPGVLIPEDPIQQPVQDAKPWDVAGYHVIPLATYDIRARVLSTERYHMGRETDLSPLDLLLGWGPMSDQANLDKMQFKQGSRWGYWRYSEPVLTDQEIAQHAANTHILPANDEIRAKVLGLRRGDLVRLRGKLVEVKADDGWTWRSSLTRNDTRGRSCEVLWLEQIDRLEPPEPAP